jgi:hypothetical protein
MFSVLGMLIAVVLGSGVRIAVSDVVGIGFVAMGKLFVSCGLGTQAVIGIIRNIVQIILIFIVKTSVQIQLCSKIFTSEMLQLYSL